MPKKINGGGQMQEYIPKGNGDASGEYADSSGQNKHFVTFAKPLPANFNQPTPKTKTSKAQNGTNSANSTQNATNTQDNTQNAKNSDKIGSFDLKKVKVGKNILEEGKIDLDYNKFDYGIESAMNQQGYDGLPQIVDKKTFDEMVKKSKFLAQRGIKAPTKRTLDAYTKQLYEGKWYVDCSTGGAQYGQGMYCVGNYKGKVTPGMQSEVRAYSAGNYSRIEQFTLTPDAKVIEHQDIIKELKNQAKNNPKLRNAMMQNMDKITTKQMNEWYNGTLTGELHDLFYNSSFDISDARMIFHSNEETKKYAMHQIEYEIFGDVKSDYKLSKDEQQAIKSKLGASKYDSIKDVAKTIANQFNKASNIKQYQNLSNYSRDGVISTACANFGLNDGTLATLMGYDAIQATGHGNGSTNGEDSHYTVILNRTKCAFLKQ